MADKLSRNLKLIVWPYIINAHWHCILVNVNMKKRTWVALHYDDSNVSVATSALPKALKYLSYMLQAHFNGPLEMYADSVQARQTADMHAVASSFVCLACHFFISYVQFVACLMCT